MTEYYEQQIETLHQELAAVYRLSRGGSPLTQQEHIKVLSLWARIERLMKTNVLIETRGVTEGPRPIVHINVKIDEGVSL